MPLAPAPPCSPAVVFFSSVSGNTARFVAKLERPAYRIPLHASEPALVMSTPFVLITPTYGGGDGTGAVPKQVIRFLNIEDNRSLIRGVISGGNTNFGAGYGIAGDIISRKCDVPHLYRFEVFGTAEDVDRVTQGLDRL